MVETGLKGNDGKAARRKLSTRLFLVIGVFVVCLCVVTFYGGGSRRGTTNGLLRPPFPLDNHRRPHGSVGVGDDDILAPSTGRSGESFVRDDIRALLHKRRLTSDEKMALILSASVHLTTIHPGSSKTLASFCRLRWNLHKEDPATVPMFRDLLSKSGHCQDHEFSVELEDIIDQVRAHDQEVARRLSLDNSPDLTTTTHHHTPYAIPPTGFVFHESRCGSTLVANSLAAVDPAQHRVYSESQPALAALTSCGEEFHKCSLDDAARLFRDVVYLMGRTDDPRETRLFFKIQSVGVKSLDVVREAFPDTPWIFVYREPVQVMMSHLPNQTAIRQGAAVCLRNRKYPPKVLRRLVQDREPNQTPNDLTMEEYCAAHLATLCQAALTEYNNNPTMGRMVNYVDLPQGLLDSVFPNHFGIDIGPDEEERVNQVCKLYSKSKTNVKEWKEDSQKKDKKATDEIRSASLKWLGGIYDSMEATKPIVMD